MLSSNSEIRKLQIVVAVDDKYTYPLLILLYSLKTNSVNEFEVTIGYSRNELSQNSIKLICDFACFFSIRIKLHPLNIWDGLPTEGHISITTFSKLILAEELSHEFIWIDIDTVVLPKWDEAIALENLDFIFPIYARREEILYDSRNQAIVKNQNNYVNTGVMFVSPKVWRQRIQKSSLQFALENYANLGFQFKDQDVINWLLKDDFHKLEDSYNFYANREKFYKSVKILHFLGGGMKPWTLTSRFGKRLLVLGSKRRTPPYSIYFILEKDLHKRIKLQGSLKVQVRKYQALNEIRFKRAVKYRYIFLVREISRVWNLWR